MLLDQHHAGVFSLEMIARKAAHNPALLFGIKDRGFIREGYFADLVVVDLAATTTVSREQIRYKCAWSPFEGHTFNSAVVMTVLGGRVVFDHGVAAPQATGAELIFRGD
jgi:dihydroorotase